MALATCHFGPLNTAHYCLQKWLTQSQHQWALKVATCTRFEEIPPKAIYNLAEHLLFSFLFGPTYVSSPLRLVKPPNPISEALDESLERGWVCG